MILKNKRTRECIQLSYVEFQVKFAKEIQAALESYTKTKNNKSYFKINQTLETVFYFNLQWNFNHFGMSDWYIEKM